MNKIKLMLAVTAIILLFFTGCDKYHRNRYVGDWDFVTERIFYDNRIDLAEIKRDTIYYSGKIRLGESEDEDDIYIQYTENSEIYAWIENKNIYAREVGYMLGIEPSGKFESTNKMNLSLYWNFYLEELLECRLEHIVGTKKKGGK